MLVQHPVVPRIVVGLGLTTRHVMRMHATSVDIVQYCIIGHIPFTLTCRPVFLRVMSKYCSTDCEHQPCKHHRFFQEKLLDDTRFV